MHPCHFRRVSRLIASNRSINVHTTPHRFGHHIYVVLVMSLPLHLRSYREKSKDEVNRDFFNVPTQEQLPVPSDPPSAVKIRHKEGSGVGAGMQGMDINAVLSVEGKEEVYVS